MDNDNLQVNLLLKLVWRLVDACQGFSFICELYNCCYAMMQPISVSIFTCCCVVSASLSITRA